MSPLRKIEHVAFVQKYRRWREPRFTGVGLEMQDVWVHPLSGAEVARIQRSTLRHFRTAARGFDQASHGVDYLDDVIWELELMEDFNYIIDHVKGKLERVRKRLEERSQSAPEVGENDEADETPAETISKHNASDPEPTSTPKRRMHLARAVKILTRHPDLQKKKHFLEKVREMKAELGMQDSDDPGVTIWTTVQQRLLPDILDLKAHESTPEHYQRMEGFYRLVRDLTAGSATKEPPAPETENKTAKQSKYGK